jgi:hypothetical protein
MRATSRRLGSEEVKGRCATNAAERPDPNSPMSVTVVGSASPLVLSLCRAASFFFFIV